MNFAGWPLLIHAVVKRGFFDAAVKIHTQCGAGVFFQIGQRRSAGEFNEFVDKMRPVVKTGLDGKIQHIHLTTVHQLEYMLKPDQS